MRIALTYDLRDEYLAAGYGELETAEFDRPDTIDALDGALRTLGHATVRVGHARNLITCLARGDRWDLVFNICEGLRGVGRESQVPAILDAYGIPYTFSDPAVMSVCLHKGLAKMVVRDAGLPTPRFALIDDIRQLTVEALSDTLRQLTFPLFIKPAAEGTGKGIGPESRVADQQQLAVRCAALLEQYQQPVLLEEHLPGREFTVGILGTGDKSRCLGTLEIRLLDQAEPEVYSYVNKERCEELVDYQLVRAAEVPEVAECATIALAAWRALGCRDGGRIDLRCDAQGRPQFLEANPLAGLHPSHSDLPMLATAIGMSYVDLIGQIVDSARTRCQRPWATVLPAGDRPSRRGGVTSPVPVRDDHKCVVILYSETTADDRVDEQDVLVQRDAVSDALVRLGHEPKWLTCTLDLESLRKSLRELQPDLVFNLVESLGETDRLMVLVPLLLERLAIPFTGASANVILATSDKLAAKSRLLAAGLPTPAWYPCDDDRVRRPGASTGEATWVVKPVWEHASLGMDDRSVVQSTDWEQLESIIETRQWESSHPHFAEEFIDGREFNLSLLDGVVLPPAEIDFGDYPPGKPRIVGHRAKWQPESFEYQHTPRTFDFPAVDSPLLEELSDLALRCWDLFQPRGAARVDFRVDRDGRPWILEVNVNPCLSPDAGFAAALEQAGMKYEAAIQRLLESAAPMPANRRCHRCLS